MDSFIQVFLGVINVLLNQPLGVTHVIPALALTFGPSLVILLMVEVWEGDDDLRHHRFQLPLYGCTATLYFWEISYYLIGFSFTKILSLIIALSWTVIYLLAHTNREILFRAYYSFFYAK